MGWLDRRTRHGSPIGPREADDLVRAGAVLLDVREPFEWHAGHAAAATHIPLGELGSRLGELAIGARVMVVCRSGHRSANATAALAGAGYDAVNLEGGMVAWAAAGLAVVRTDGAPGTIA